MTAFPATPRGRPGLVAASARLRGRGPGVAAARRALRRAALGRFSAPERDWLARIEGLRAQLRASTERIEVDMAAYAPTGAGAPTIQVPVAEAIAGSATDPLKGRLLFALVRELRPQRCLELGTNLGLGAAYVAAGLELNGSGGLVTIELSAAAVEVARRNHSDLGLARCRFVTGNFDDELGPVLAAPGPVELAYVDGNHREEPTRRYFEAIASATTTGGIAIFDDVDTSDGMRRAWGAIASDQRTRASARAHGIGIAVVGQAT
jgi:predicted O-methyltransferase YrrM